MRSSIVGFDVLKLIMSFWVVAIHCWIKDFSDCLYRISQLAVPCFFVISGFLLEKKTFNPNYYITWLRKIVRLYMIWIVIYLPFSIYQFLTCENPYSESIYWYIRNVFISGDFYQGWHLWYLLALIQVGSVMAILKRYNVHSEGIVIACFVLILIFTNGHNIYYIQKATTLINKIYPNGRYVFFSGFVFMALGTLVSKWEFLRKNIFLSLFTLVVALVLYVYQVHFSLYILSFALVNTVASVKSQKEKLCRIAYNVRNISTLIYLVHMVPLGIIDIYWNYELEFIPLFTYAIITSLILSMLILYMSRFKKLYWLRNIW